VDDELHFASDLESTVRRDTSKENIKPTAFPEQIFFEYTKMLKCQFETCVISAQWPMIVSYALYQTSDLQRQAFLRNQNLDEKTGYLIGYYNICASDVSDENGSCS
jgi:hypothetical protein